MAKEYLGDGAYVERDKNWSDVVVLTTSNGVEDTNTIILEPKVLAAFLAWIQKEKESQ